MSQPNPQNLHQEVALLIRVLARAGGMVLAHWDNTNTYPAQHPYRLALLTVVEYLKTRQG